MFPAPAGINRPRRTGAGTVCSVPRASGDKPEVMKTSTIS
ncbi:hypothetical protein ECDEC13D_3159 [Escherichia coli DEC13D]|nr:hypothetical protein ECDEC13C_3346 [Escherichia coli DEC13C]EHX62009.1 hypothetical protein ECDEC13D_3159 [Escherichia coli DEC13D]